MLLLQGCGGECVAGAPPESGAGRVPDPGQGPGRIVLGRGAQGGEVRRELRQHLAVQRALDQRRRQQRRAVENRADGRGHVVGEAVGGDQHRQPAAQHVVAQRGQAAAVADELAQDRGVDRWAERAGLREPRQQSGRRARERLRPVAGGPVPRGRGHRPPAIGERRVGGEPVSACGRSGGPRHRIRRARRPIKDSAGVDSGYANIHESSDPEGVTGQTQGPALNIGAQRLRREHPGGRHARGCTGEPERARHLGGPRRDDADAAAGHLDVQRGRRVVQHPDRAVGGGAQVLGHPGRRADRKCRQVEPMGAQGDHASRRYRPPLHLAAVRLCQ